MMQFKAVALLIIAVSLIFGIYTIASQCSYPRTITVYKRSYTDSNKYLKGYKNVKGSVEKFDIKVTPVTFWDRILLTDEDDNLLSGMFKVLAGLICAYYFYNLSYDNIFSKKSFNLFWLTLLFGVFSYVAFGIGAGHTKDFFINLYLTKGGTDDIKYDFQSRLNMFDQIHDWEVYMIFLCSLSLYRTFSNHYEGKEDASW
jgi:hypothetical protein